MGMSLINTIVVAGGTHGNERTGVRLVQKWMEHPECYNTLCSAKVDLVLANPEAVRLNRRYRDYDLNRAFSQTCLDVTVEPQQYTLGMGVPSLSVSWLSVVIFMPPWVL